MNQTILSLSFWTALLASGLRMSIPLLYAGLGEMISERSGILNIGMEGVMLCGAFFSFAGAYYTHSLAAGILCGILGGTMISLIHALLCVTGKQNQTVSGLALNMLALGVTSYLYKLMCNSGAHLQTAVLSKIDLPFLCHIPVIGEAFFRQDIMAYIAYLLVIAAFLVYRYTRIGLNLSSIGENPMAADAAGIRVELHQIISCLAGGILGGAGGAYLTIAQLGLFSDNMTAGRGYIALAAVILGRYSPSGVLLASLLFGLANAAQIRLQAISSTIPVQALAMLPYLITLAALLITGGRSREPEALAKPYIRGGR